MVAHRVTHLTSTGCTEVLRLFGAPDCDMAAMYVTDLFGSKVQSVVAVDEDAPRQWGEMDFQGVFQ